ncbi:interleukin 12 receptor, beta 2a, like [Pangasianodon hypophthalmus]|uniref:interleukin 12 receptor, beta 2a, like n=1 Tax=Pangasianodon hypophthalmus TaxID=310915 RepID=UPI000EFF4A56|nr:interleukin 12 receptor, beta 2a, like [Pangasianodon hypophthalmus]XP_053095171.1 interleukin 12 receptor, beta 2a, like [Pangasianodon hypophthalmus]
MMAVWQSRALILPLLTLHIIWLSPHASFGLAVRCWWRRVSSVIHNVSIECQADPQGAMLECDLCHLHVLPLNPAAHVSQTECSHMSVSFSTLIDAHEMQKAECMLLCPGHTPGHTHLPCLVQEGYPPPTCLIPFNDEDRNIHCRWTGSLNPLIPTNFTLHWRNDDYGYNGSKDIGGRDSVIILRADYQAHDCIEMWVSATNTLEKINSETLKTNTHSIIQPPPPSIIRHTSEPLEIFWSVSDEIEHSEQWQCKVQYKKLCDQDWTEVEDTYEVSFILEDAVPFTTYKFRVRCRHASDERAVMSTWSSEFTAETPAAAPVGMLDVWSDCDSMSDESNCTILWKEMPKQQARGNINSYVVTMKLSNGSVLNINGSVYTSAETCAQCGLDIITKEPSNLVSHAQQSYLTCRQEQSCFHYCHLSVPVKEVKGIGVTANTAGGKSSPALVALPRTGLLQPTVALEVRAKSQELNVSWSVLLPFSDSVQEYVVQHKPVGLPYTPCLNWVKVHKNQTFVILRGQMSNYTAYNVSLYAIVSNRSCLLTSAIAYTVEGVPPKVTDFQAIPTSPFSVNLTWTPIPLNKSQGHIMQYLVGFCKDVVVYNVSSDKSSFQISNLNPDQQYEVWIRAKTSAGEGENATASFTTTSSANIIKIVVVIVVLVFITPLVLIISIVWYLRAKVPEWFYKIPDPINSSSFKQMSNQFWHSWPVSSASMEYGLTISQVEVVPEPEVDHEPEVEQPEEHREHRESRGKELQGFGGLEQNNSVLRHQKEYSQMIDSSDEEGRQDEDEEWNEEPFPSDYEKHFLPCIVDA